MVKIELLTEATFDVESLADILLDAVDSGASIGFLPPMSRDEARDYWREVQAAGHLAWGAFVEGKLVGTVQLALANKPNARHRAEVQELLVLRANRRQGIARELMLGMERHAQALGRVLLVLDTKLGDDAERLYERLGYQRVGALPGYVRNADGSLAATVIFYKQLDLEQI